MAGILFVFSNREAQTLAPLTYERTVAVERRADDVLQAWLEPAELAAWLAESDGVGTQPGELYALRGRLLPAGCAGTTIRARTETELRFGLLVAGEETEVAVAVKPVTRGFRRRGDSCRVVLQHTAPADMRDFWDLALTNLRLYAEQGRPGLRHNFTIPEAGAVRRALVLGALPATAFRHLTDPELLGRWLGLPGRVAVTPGFGGSIDLGWGAGPQPIVGWDPPRRLTLAWPLPPPDAALAPGGQTRLTCTLRPLAGGCRLELEHGGFAPGAGVGPYGLAWSALLNGLKLLVETGHIWEPPAAPEQDA